MADLQVVGLGLSTIDVLSRLEVMPTWEKGTFLKQIGTDGGGPVGTALVAAARLGARVGYVGVCGNDESAELKLRYLTRDGVDISSPKKWTGSTLLQRITCIWTVTILRLLCKQRAGCTRPVKKW